MAQSGWQITSYCPIICPYSNQWDLLVYGSKIFGQKNVIGLCYNVIFKSSCDTSIAIFNIYAKRYLIYDMTWMVVNTFINRLKCTLI